MKIKLKNPNHVLPWPNVPGRFVKGDEVVEINPSDSFWRACLKDGSVIEIKDQDPPAAVSRKTSKE